MNKREFLDALRIGLSGMPKDDMEERLLFYGEMIDDRMEEGLSEEEAVCEIGDTKELISQIVADIPLTKLVKEKIKPKKRLKAWEIVLLILGSPIWLALAVAAFAVILSLYIVLWAAIISLWAVFGSMVGSSFGALAAGIILICNGNGLAGVGTVGAALACGGLSVFVFFGCRAATKGVLILTKKLAVWIKNDLIKKEDAQ